MKSEYQFIELTSAEEMIKYLDLMHQMYPEMSVERYKSLLNDMIPMRYKQIAVLQGEQCVGISGYWVNTRLFCDKYIDIDNFVVHKDYRSKGIGKILLDKVLERGKQLGCKTAVLDAFVENFGASKFYYREGFVARGNHFLKYI